MRDTLTSNLLAFLLLLIVGSKQECFASNEGAYYFEVSQWTAGCARSCYYDFRICGPAYNNVIPAFSGHCSGDGEGAPFKPCVLDEPSTPSLPTDNKRIVAARLEATNRTGTGAHIVVSYQFTDKTQCNKLGNYTGYATSKYNQFTSLPLQFIIIPTKI